MEIDEHFVQVDVDIIYLSSVPLSLWDLPFKKMSTKHWQNFRHCPRQRLRALRTDEIPVISERDCTRRTFWSIWMAHPHDRARAPASFPSVSRLKAREYAAWYNPLRLFRVARRRNFKPRRTFVAATCTGGSANRDIFGDIYSFRKKISEREPSQLFSTFSLSNLVPVLPAIFLTHRLSRVFYACFYVPSARLWKRWKPNLAFLAEIRVNTDTLFLGQGVS